MKQIQMVDLEGQYNKIKTDVDRAILDTISSWALINGPQVKTFGENLSSYLGADHCMPCGNGTDALQIALMALDLEPGDEVITVPFTFIATAEVISLLGLRPVFVDIEPGSFNMNVDKLEQAITAKTRCIIPVHLFGQLCNMEEINTIASKYGIPVVEDNAQSIGADYRFKDGTTKKGGALGTIGCTSFYPSKTLGAYGDGGAIFTNDDKLAEKINMITNHGSRVKYYHEVVGVNSRLDSIQASILDIKLKYLDEYINARQRAASYYDHAFQNLEAVKTPAKVDYSTHVYHQYTLLVEDREELQSALKDKNVPTMVYYPVPLHLQKAYQQYGYSEGDFPVSESVAKKVLSLPMHTELDEDQLKYITEAVIGFYQSVNV